MPSGPHIVLIGLRGSGKSTLGLGLSKALTLAFTDLDELVSERAGYPGAGALIADLGFDRFREEETLALNAVLEEETRVIALGGGTPIAPGAPALLAGPRTRVMYLRAMPETLQERLRESENTDRPALVGDDPVSEIQIVFDQRDALYQDLAESIIHVDGVTEHSALAALIVIAKSGV